MCLYRIYQFTTLFDSSQPKPDPKITLSLRMAETYGWIHLSLGFSGPTLPVLKEQFPDGHSIALWNRNKQRDDHFPPMKHMLLGYIISQRYPYDFLDADGYCLRDGSKPMLMWATGYVHGVTPTNLGGATDADTGLSRNRLTPIPKMVQIFLLSTWSDRQYKRVNPPFLDTSLRGIWWVSTKFYQRIPWTGSSWWFSRDS